MSEPSSLQGLSCPNCGGIVPVPEGQLIVKCPYCDLRSMVRGERGLLRYQVPLQVDRNNANSALKKFLSRSMAIASAAKNEARLVETLLVYLPFWTIWERLAAWVFGEKKVGSGDDAHYEPREVRILQDLTWNGAAADVGEFGVTNVPPVDQNLEPYDSEVMHSRGMVFEPVGSFSEADQSARAHFENHVERSAHLDRIGQIFSRPFRHRNAVVYHPLWVLRYLFRNRSFQVVVDGYTGKILYGKAPGNTLYRAAVLILGMAFGAFLSIDIPVLILANSDSGDAIWPALLLFGVGLGIMLAAYRKYRRGEQYEFRLNPPEQAGWTGNPLEMITSVRDVEKWIDRLS